MRSRSLPCNRTHCPGTGAQSACGLYIVDVATKTITPLLPGVINGTDKSECLAAEWSPDGKRIAYLRRQQGGTSVAVEIVRPDGTGRVLVWEQAGIAPFEVRWRPQ